MLLLPQNLYNFKFQENLIRIELNDFLLAKYMNYELNMFFSLMKKYFFHAKFSRLNLALKV